MAKIKNIQHFSHAGSMGTVGNNRFASTSKDGRTTSCSLHGHQIVEINLMTGKLTLNACGYHTTTTRQAMADFLGALNIVGKVSFANHKFSACIYGVDKETTGDVLEFDLEPGQLLGAHT